MRLSNLSTQAGLTLDHAWSGLVEAVLNTTRVNFIGTTRVNFIGREALILNKKMTGRAKDKADLEALGVE